MWGGGIIMKARGMNIGSEKLFMLSDARGKVFRVVNAPDGCCGR